MKKKLFPFPALLALGLSLYFFLVGNDDNLGGSLYILVLFLGIWYCFGPDMKPPSSQAPDWRAPNPLRFGEEDFRRYQSAESLVQEMALWMWCLRLYEDKAYRDKILALSLTGLLVGTGLLAWLNENVLFRRALWIMGLCVLGLLILFFIRLPGRLRKGKEEPARTVFPAPQVNLNYNHDAAADGRVRMLRQRLDQLDEWKRSGLIENAEYEALRQKILHQEKTSE